MTIVYKLLGLFGLCINWTVHTRDRYDEHGRRHLEVVGKQWSIGRLPRSSR